MRAKVKVSRVEVFRAGQTNSQISEEYTTSERLTLNAVYKNQYDSTGKDEDNTYALWTPNAEFTINITNPNLFGKFKVDQKYYVDFTLADE